MESIEITDRGASQVSRGLLWVFSNEIYKKPASLKPGTWCTFHCRSKIVATGYANPHSLIFGRVVTTGDHKDMAALLKKRVEDAFARRPGLGPTQAARLVYSEADFLPGLVLDVYADNAVLQSNTAGIDAVLPELESIVPAVFKQTFGRALKGFVIKADAGIRRLEGVGDFMRIVTGDEKSLSNVGFEEDGVHFTSDLLKGQKTGFFLDQRQNRAFLANLVKTSNRKKVLDLCCYSGGWGLRALQNGAEHATFVDESAAAIALVENGLQLNGIEKKRTRRVTSDVFRFLEQDETLYDVIVADPPAFVKSKKNLPQAIKGYEKLNRLAWRRLNPGGVLITCSCSYHVSDEEFLDLLHTSVGKEKGWARVLYRGSQAPDHPVLLSMPETRYLKCVALEKVEIPANDMRG